MVNLDEAAATALAFVATHAWCFFFDLWVWSEASRSAFPSPKET